MPAPAPPTAVARRPLLDGPPLVITGAAGGLGRACAVEASGTTWRDGRQIEPSAQALDCRLALTLWLRSCARCGIADPARVSPGA